MLTLRSELAGFCETMASVKAAAVPPNYNCSQPKLQTRNPQSRSVVLSPKAQGQSAT